MKQKKTRETKKIKEKSYRGEHKTFTSHFPHLTSDSRGITLIALVITIIVMLILVAVTINIAAQGKLFNYAGNAVNETEIAKGKENEILDGKITVGGNTYNSIDEYIDSLDIQNSQNPTNPSTPSVPTEPSVWKDNGNDTFTDETTGKTVNVGDFVKYDSPLTYDDDGTKGWRILGVENGKLLIMADTNVGTQILEGKDGFDNGVNYLNSMCEGYKDDKYATSARSITIEDINKTIGYNPLCVGVKNPTKEQIASGTKFNNGGADYGTKWKYAIKSGKLYYGTNAENPCPVPGNNSFYPLGNSTTMASGSQVTIEQTGYDYYPETLTRESTEGEAVSGISNTSSLYDMIFNNNNGSNETYWLASSCTYISPAYASWSFHIINGGRVSSEPVWNSATRKRSNEIGVRPVVTLSSSVYLGEGSAVLGKDRVMSYEIINK